MNKFFRNKSFLMGFIIISIFMIFGIFANYITPHDPFLVSGEAKLNAPSLKYLFGTDEYGRDILSRIILGSRTTLLVVFSSIAIAIFIGVLFGLIAGFYGKWLEIIIMRLQDGILAFPVILLAILIIAIIQPGYAPLIITIGVIYIPSFARLVRSRVLVVKETEFLKASIIEGASNGYLIFKVVLPNILSVIMINASLTLSVAILIESALSYLGLGIQPPTPSWGLMLKASQSYISIAPWYVVAPGLSIVLLVFGFSLMGDGIREVTCPKLRI
jgi:peptide/nickel transport system permease protein